MGHFRGTVIGNRATEVSRLGTKKSGLHVNAASWEGAVQVDLWHDETEGVDMAEVSLVKHHGAGVTELLYRGPVSGNPLLRCSKCNRPGCKGEEVAF